MGQSVCQALANGTDSVSAFNGICILVREPGKQADRMQVRLAGMERCWKRRWVCGAKAAEGDQQAVLCKTSQVSCAGSFSIQALPGHVSTNAYPQGQCNPAAT